MTRWTQIDREPNAGPVKNWRRERLSAAHRPPTADRVSYLAQLAQAKHTLDVGIVDHDSAKASAASWLHKHTAATAASCLGVDILPGHVRALAQAGYHVQCCDVTDPAVYRKMDSRFDVIICGELIEHLSRPAALFEAANHLLSTDGRLVVTTPNPFCIWTMYRHLRGRGNENVDHVLLGFPSGMAELAERAGLKLAVYRGTQITGGATNHKIAYVMGHMLRFMVKQEAFCTTMIYEFTRDRETAGAR